jgi:hypothetical protein
MTKTETYSSLTLSRECARKYYWKQVCHLVPKKQLNKNLIVGKAIHAGVAGVNTKSISKILEPLKLINEKLFLQWEVIVDVMLEAYYDRWGYTDASLEEIKFKIPIDCKKHGIELEHNYFYEGLIDGVEAEDNIVKMVELKSTSESGIENYKMPQKFLNRLYLEWQTDFYAFALSRMGLQVDSIEYRFIKKPTIKLLIKETPIQYKTRLSEKYLDPKNSSEYLADETLYPRSNYNYVELQIVRIIQLIEHYHETNWWPKDFMACNNWSGCQYMSLCNDYDENLKYFKKEEPHGELRK